MDKRTRHNIFGMVVYMCIAMLFGGCLAVAAGMGLRYWAFGVA